MCGICGIVHTRQSGRLVTTETLERMRDTMTHRGPDDAGILVLGRLGLGHRRLSIVDLEGGHQPMRLGERPLHIVYNGEVYNHLELKSRLEAQGHRYRTRCDTETVLRSYAQEGETSVERLRGMFAFAVWDEDAGSLFLARDRLGIKPLYYVLSDDGSLYFASEIKALLEAGAVRPALNHRALPDYLANHAPSGDQTLFHGVRRLLPGHTLLWEDGRVRVSRYWELDPCPDITNGTDRDLEERFGELLEESVRLRLMADVPLGVFLSGGIDSAAIASLMADMVDGPINTFSVAFREREANELLYARMVSKAIRSTHHEVLVSPGEFFGALPRLVWHEDEPLAHPSSVPLHFVSMLASKNAKVVLTGEGSDELLGGYARYWKTGLNLGFGRAFHRVLPGSLTSAIARLVSATPKRGLTGKLHRTFLTLPADLQHLYLDNFAVFGEDSQKSLLSDGVMELTDGVGPYQLLEPLFERAEGCPLLQQLLYVDMNSYLQELLMKQDQMSMSASLESRVPFLDHPLVEFAFGLPQRMKIRRWTTKYILRRAVRNRVPPQILTRRKMGFPVPFGTWVREGRAPLVDQLLTDGRLGERGILRAGVMERMLGEHKAGVRDHSFRLWSIVGLEAWMRIFLEGESPETVVDGASASSGGMRDGSP